VHISIDTSGGVGTGQNYVLPPTDEHMPFITAWLSYDPEECKYHLPPGAQNDFDALIFCSPFPGYTSGPNTANPQPYLVWSVMEHTCQAGYNDQCASMADLQADAQQWNGKVFFDLIQEEKYNSYDYALSPTMTTRVMPMQNCPSDMTVRIELIIIYDQGAASSPPSNQVTIPCKQPLGSSVPIYVTFQSMHLSNVDDNDPGVDDLELYGSFETSTGSGFHEERTLGNWNDAIRDTHGCPNEDFNNILNSNGNVGGGCLANYVNGTNSLASVEMCATDFHAGCWFSQTNTYTEFKVNNNTIQVNVVSGDSISLLALAYDYDSQSADDSVCYGQGVTLSRTRTQWANMKPETLTLSSPDYGSGSCTITVKISVTP
jgi:hypothetical protein